MTVVLMFQFSLIFVGALLIAMDGDGDGQAEYVGGLLLSAFSLSGFFSNFYIANNGNTERWTAHYLSFGLCVAWAILMMWLNIISPRPESLIGWLKRVIIVPLSIVCVYAAWELMP